jgi:hypothetical protein
MNSISEILKGFSNTIGIKESGTLTVLRKKWTILCGEVIAAHTFPWFIKGHILHIKVDSPQWIHHLSFLKREMLEKLSEFEISDIRHSIGYIPHTPKSIEKSNENHHLSENDKEFIQKTISCLKDKKTREAFESLMIKSLSRPRNCADKK